MNLSQTENNCNKHEDVIRCKNVNDYTLELRYAKMTMITMYNAFKWQQRLTGELQCKAMFHCDSSMPSGQQFVLNAKNIAWTGEKIEVHALLHTIKNLYKNVI